MKIIIISTGNEILRGLLVDTNSAWLASKLEEDGYSVHSMVTVGDCVEDISSALKSATASSDLVVVTGGLGPTEDDLTALAAARTGGVPLVRNELAAAQIAERFAKFSRQMPEINLKQADLPAGCTLLENPVGTAPGFAMKIGSAEAFFLPGVPLEMKRMYEQHVRIALPRPTDRVIRASLRCFGRGESDIQALLTPIARAHPKVSWAYRVTFPEIGLTLTSPDDTELQHAVTAVKETLGKTVFHEGSAKLPEVLGRALSEKNLTIATAESCTGGLIGHTLTEVPGSSAYFRGGIIAYHNEVKTDVLGVDSKTLEAHGAVSKNVVVEMAAGICRSHRADFGLAVSGIAGPTGGTAEKPVGLVHLAVAHPNGIEHKQRNFGDFGRSRIKTLSAWAVMWMALEILKNAR